ncbi:MAG TPA: PaaX family transcriptional regulator C-terminal domain-containing protein [Kofleriaceae bacterium]
MKPTAKRIILELMSVNPGVDAPAAMLVAAAELLGIEANNVRVTLTRLVADGTLETSGRGLYQLGKTTRALTKQITSWRELEKQVRPWDGSWACVHFAVGTADRVAARRRKRALGLLGFRALDRPSARALAMRPNNLDGGVAALREQLYALGVEETAIVLLATELDAATEQRARRLWAAERLTQGYVQTRERIERWLIAIDELPLRTAAREAFFFGGDVLRKIMFDPRLPEPLVDVAERRALLEAAKRLDTTGRRLWMRLFAVPKGLVNTEHREHARN